MSNETGKEIYKEYVNKWIDVCDYDLRVNINKEYLWCNKPLETASLCDKAGNYQEFTRAPKMQIINGHEVVAPRYDEFNIESEMVLVYTPLSPNCIHELSGGLSEAKYRNIQKQGWFDNYDDIKAYAKALRGSK